MIFYQLVDLPKICLLHEAATWLALGRLPELCTDEDGEEPRSQLYSLLNDQCLIDKWPYNSAEIEAVGIDIDFDEYADAVIGHAATKDALFNGYSSAVNNFWYHGPPRPELFRKTELLEEVNTAMDHHISKAELKILLALMEGRLSAYGYAIPAGWHLEEGVLTRDEDEQDDKEFEEVARVETVPPELWNTENIKKYFQDEVFLSNGYLGLWVEIEELLSCFPTPDIKSQPINATRYASTLILKDAQTLPTSTKTSHRGRPRKENGLIEKAVINEFRRRKKQNVLPEKKEAVLQECMEWVEQIFNKNLARTTAQSWLKKLDAQ